MSLSESSGTITVNFEVILFIEHLAATKAKPRVSVFHLLVNIGQPGLQNKQASLLLVFGILVSDFFDNLPGFRYIGFEVVFVVLQ